MNTHTHTPGTGLHYINDRYEEYADGSFQLGDTSECCVLYTAQKMLTSLGLPSLLTLWNETYTDDRMSSDDMEYILASALTVTNEFKIGHESVALILSDLDAIGCYQLADSIRGLLTHLPLHLV